MSRVDFKAALDMFNRHISERGLKSTRQRELILRTFLEADEHIDIEELYRRVKARNGSIGHATVYRTMKLLTECGLALERHFGVGLAQYEHVRQNTHHDHLICRTCGKIEEFVHPTIEELQEEVAKAHGFTIFDHRLEIYGECSDCHSRV